MVLSLKKYTLTFLLLTFAFGAVHFFIGFKAPGFLGVSVFLLFQIYAFLIFLNVLNFIGLRWLFIKWPKYAGLLFSALSMIKMGICIVFLIPYIFPSTPSSVPFVFNFMAVYFISLLFEVIFIAKNMNKV
jgi:hypothetical protein